MKSINVFPALRYLAIMLIVSLIYSCKPEEFTKSLPAAPTTDQIKITATPSPENPNIITLKNETPGTITAVWDLGNGGTATGNSATGSYAVKGNYTVKLTVFTAGGYAINTQTITIANTNELMLNREDYNFLTGGAAATGGKTWRVEGETKGHLGVGPVETSTPDWYSAGANEKSTEGLYDDRMTFKLKDFVYTYDNKGNTFSNFQFASDLGGPTTTSDVTVSYTPPTNTTWSIVEEGGKKYLSISNGGFIGYYSGATRYEIISLTEDELYLKGNSKKPSDAWYQRLVREGFVRPIIPKPVKSADIFDNFDVDGNVTWKMENLTLNESYDNPGPVPVNTSPKVAMYVKQEGQAFEFANMFTDFNYKFDLTTRNIFKLKVFIPSYNDFVTAAGEDWANKNLLKQVSIKLQDGTSAQPWVNQVEVKQAVTTLDRWVELTFDFSGAVGRKDLDRIVIQIGGEGNFIPGVFFLDDFKLEK